MDLRQAAHEHHFEAAESSTHICVPCMAKTGLLVGSCIAEQAGCSPLPGISSAFAKHKQSYPALALCISTRPTLLLASCRGCARSRRQPRAFTWSSYSIAATAEGRNAKCLTFGGVLQELVRQPDRTALQQAFLWVSRLR